MRGRLLAGWVLLLTLLGAAQESASVSLPSDEPERPVRAELGLVRQHMQDAFNARDIESLLEGVTEDVVLTTLSGEVVRGKEGLRQYFERMVSGPKARVKEIKTEITVDELTVLFEGRDDVPDLGLAFGRSEDRYVMADGTSVRIEPNWSAMLVRAEAGWRIAGFHYSTSMYDNPVVSEAKGRAVYGIASALLFGLGVGYLVGRRRKPAL